MKLSSAMPEPIPRTGEPQPPLYSISLLLFTVANVDSKVAAVRTHSTSCTHHITAPHASTSQATSPTASLYRRSP